jgi:hypothetical protein
VTFHHIKPAQPEDWHLALSAGRGGGAPAAEVAHEGGEGLHGRGHTVIRHYYVFRLYWLPTYM